MPKEKTPWLEAHLVASIVTERLRPYCQRIEVAGSIRRKTKFVNDIEIVAIPNLEAEQHDMFADDNTSTIWPGRRIIGEIVDYFPKIKITHGTHAGEIIDTGGTSITKDGPRYIQFTHQGHQVDLFLTTPEKWGVIYAIRTGPAEFSKKLVTEQRTGGFMPDGFKVKDGRVWFGSTAHDTPDELSLFALYGMDMIAPEDRE